MIPARIHVLYEYGADFRPHASSYVRLLRPLTHPSFPEHLETSFGTRLEDHQSFQVVIVDRLWRPDITPDLAEDLVQRIRQMGALMIFALDDNLHDLALERMDWPEERHLRALEIFLSAADQVWVTTQALKARLDEKNPNIRVIPNNLDERLLVGGRRVASANPFGPRRTTIGYMGTRSHDQDLQMVTPALRQISERHKDKVGFQIVGVVSDPQVLQELEGIPYSLCHPPQEETEYPLFQLWFGKSVDWDIAISPLRETPFNQCKSDIKFLDYGAVGAAGIYSQVPAYAGSVEHGRTGLLVENTASAWEEALETLLEKDQLRSEITANASRYLYVERTLAPNIRYWVSALDNLLGLSSD